MRWDEGSGPSGDIEDRRGQGGGGGGGFGFGGFGGRIGIGGFIVLLVLSFIFKTNLFALLGGGSSQQAVPATERPSGPEEEKMVKFVSFVLDDVQATWTREFPKATNGRPYERAKLVLFTGETRSACGTGEAAMGPFYCPGDRKAYIDLAFYQELRKRFGAPGDFAQAYVLAHEIGHHLQNLLGTEKRLRREQEANPRSANALSVRMELQADCYAGVWGHSTAERKILEAGDVEEALHAAQAIGDDTLQKEATGRVRPESFTHGSSAQRTKWFRRGFDTGELAACDTFTGDP